MTSIDKTKSNGNALHFDIEAYRGDLDGSDFTEAQKEEFLQNLWSILVSFVDLGFEIHPVQQAQSNGCEQKLDVGQLITDHPERVVSSKHTSHLKSKHTRYEQSGAAQDRSHK